MSTTVRSWLPSTAIQPEALGLPLGGVVQSWGEHWFVNEEASLVALYQDDWPAAETTGWRTLDGASIALTAAGRCAVASGMLGRSIAPHALQPNDRVLVDRLASECADDLVRRIARVASGAAPADRIRAMPLDPEDCSWWQVSLSGSRPLFRLATNRETAVGLARSLLPPARRAAVGSVRSALANQPVSVSVALGRCKMNLAELESLAPGDVLVADRSTEAPLELLLNDAKSGLFAHIRTAEQQASLVIASKDNRNA